MIVMKTVIAIHNPRVSIRAPAAVAVSIVLQD